MHVISYDGWLRDLLYANFFRAGAPRIVGLTTASYFVICDDY